MFATDNAAWFVSGKERSSFPEIINFQSYRWTSMTAAHESSRNPSTAELENMQISQESLENQPWKGDTWRISVPRGRTLDLVAAFDQCALHEQAMSSRTRRMSEPAIGSGEKEEVEEQLEIETVFIGECDKLSLLSLNSTFAAKVTQKAMIRGVPTTLSCKLTHFIKQTRY